MAKKAKTNIKIQYGEGEIDTTSFVETVKEIWKNELGRKVSEMGNIDIYVKPAENRVYYVVGGETGDFEMFPQA